MDGKNNAMPPNPPKILNGLRSIVHAYTERRSVGRTDGWTHGRTNKQTVRAIEQTNGLN